MSRKKITRHKWRREGTAASSMASTRREVAAVAPTARREGSADCRDHQETNKKMDRQSDSLADRRTDRQRDRHADRQNDRQVGG